MLDVIIADDEIWVGRMLQNLINWNDLGFNVVGVCINGFEALEKIREFHPALVLTDIKMPGLNGVELINKLRIEQPGIQFIIISGYSDFEYTQKAIEYGAAGYILKPVDKDELSKVILRVKSIILGNITKLNEKKLVDDRLHASEDKIKKHIFYNLISGIIDVSKIQEYKDELEINDVGCRFQIAILQSGNTKKTDEVVEFLTHILHENECNFISCIEKLDGGSIAMLIKSLSADRLPLDSINNVFQMLLAKIGNNISFGIGKEVEKLTDIAESYKTAQIANLYHWTQDWNQIFIYNQGDGAYEKERLCTLTLEMKIRSAIQEHDNYKVTEYIDYVIYKAIEKKDNNQNILAESIIWLLSIIKSNLPSSELEKINYDASTGVLLSTTVEAARKELLDYADSIMDYLDETHNLSKTQSLVKNAKMYIDKNYMRDIGLNDVAESVSLNANYLCTIFREETGIPFKEYLTEKRIDVAKKLLKDECLKMIEIAERVGYNDLKQFSHNFKKIVGIAPSEFRKLMIGHE